jgi:hypothetical protein
MLITRPTIFGNPFVIGPDGDREEVIIKYKEYFLDRMAVDRGFKKAILSLKGLRLGCMCKPKPCHGDVIVEWLEGALHTA